MLITTNETYPWSFVTHTFRNLWKRVIQIRKSMMNRQHNGQKKKDKRTKNDLQNIHIEHWCLMISWKSNRLHS